MGPLATMLIGAAIGAAKSKFIDEPKEARDRKKAAAFAKVSPWSGMGIPGIKEADFGGSTIGGGLTGLGLSQQFAAQPEEPDYGTMDNAWGQDGPPMANQPAYQQPVMTPSGYPVGQPGQPNYIQWLQMNATGRPQRPGPMY